MIHYAEYNASGKYIVKGSTWLMDGVEASNGGFIYFGEVDPLTQYHDVVINAPVALPERPSPNHRFDYTTKHWYDPRTLADFKDAAYKKIEEWRNQQENQTFQFTHAGRQWDAGIITRQRMQPVLGLSQLPEGFFWTDADNVDVPMDMPSLQLLSQAHEEALVIKGFEIHAQQRSMKNAVAAATTKEQVESIVIGY